jgi:hypothetical protein
LELNLGKNRHTGDPLDVPTYLGIGRGYVKYNITKK